MPYSVPSKLADAINKPVCVYLVPSPKIVSGEYTDDEFAAFYKSLIGPLAIQMSLEFARKCGGSVTLTAEPLEFLSAQTRITLLRELLPFSIISINEARKLFVLPEVEDSERRLHSLNYVAVDKVDA